MKHRLVPILTLLFVEPALAQQQVDVERYVREHQAAIVREFMELVAIPNVRTDLPNIKRNAEQLRQMLERRGMKPEVWDTPSTPMVYGRGAPGHVADFLSAVLEAPSPQHGLKRIGLFPARLVDRLAVIVKVEQDSSRRSGDQAFLERSQARRRTSPGSSSSRTGGHCSSTRSASCR